MSHALLALAGVLLAVVHVAALGRYMEAPWKVGLLGWLIAKDGVERHVFICGPDAMSAAVERALAACDIPPERIQMERFHLV